MDRTGQIVQEEYRIAQSLGEGELGNIYLAEGLKRRDKQRFALLVLREKFDAFHPQFKAVLGELKRARTLADSNLVAIEPVVGQDGMPGFVSEIVPGRRLDKRLREGPVMVKDALEIVLGLGKSLVAAHGKGLVHGDLRPANILRVHREEKSPYAGRAVLLWHSLYRLRSCVTVDSSADWLMYRPRQDLIGDGRMASMDTDIFALGAILYECLRGRPAFYGKFEEMVLENLNSPPKPLSLRLDTGLSTGLAARFDEILASACAPDPEGRPASMAQLVRMIEEVQIEVGVPAPNGRVTLFPGPRQTLSPWANVVKNDKLPVVARPVAEPEPALPPPAPAVAPPVLTLVKTPPAETLPMAPPGEGRGAANAAEVDRQTLLSPAPERATLPTTIAPPSSPSTRDWRSEVMAAVVGAIVMLLLVALALWIRSR